MFGGDKTGISRLFFMHCEQADHQPAMQRHLEKVEALEVVDCRLCMHCCTLLHSYICTCSLKRLQSHGQFYILLNSG